MAEQFLNSRMNVCCSHWLTTLRQDTNDHISDPTWTAITLPLPPDNPWLGIACP
jgi:hypothetical protein